MKIMGWFLRSVLLYSDILKFLPSKENTESAVDEKMGKPRSSPALLRESAQGVTGGRDGAVSLPITLLAPPPSWLSRTYVCLRLK